MTTKPSTEICVKLFRHILICPFLLRGQSCSSTAGDEDNPSIIQSWVDHLEKQGPWKELEGSGVSGRFSYNQIVYFHPFVRDFLFGDGNESKRNRTTRILVRQDIAGVEVELGEGQKAGTRLRFEVSRVELYLCKPSVALLVVEVTAPRRLESQGVDAPDNQMASSEAISLSQLQDFTDQFRRLYPPFFWDDIKKKQAGCEMDACEAGLCLRAIDWIGCDGERIAIEKNLPDTERVQVKGGRLALRGLGSPKKHFDEFSRVGAEPPLFAHWQWLLGSNTQPAQRQEHIRPESGKPVSGFYLQQLLDERMPVMTYYGVSEPAEVSLGDLDRITFVDASGSDKFPYNPSFLKRFRANHTYDRFAHSEYQTHYFCSGYGFSMLGKADDFTFREILQTHFSNHYFCMGLIAYFQRAALLYFADELAASVKELAGKPHHEELSSKQFRDHVEEIQHRFLKFRTRSYFAEVSNQLQGRELFRMWFRNLETEQLFQLVDTASERLTSVLAERESRKLARIAAKSAPWFIGLAVASCLFGAWSLVTTSNWGSWPSLDFWLIVATSIAAGLLSGLVFWENFDKRRPIRSLCKWLSAIGEDWRKKS